MTARRTTQQRGWVNFPTDRENSNEGGMYVQLVVVPKGQPGSADEWILCSCSLPKMILAETLIDAQDAEAALDFHFPTFRPGSWEVCYDSIEYLAVITLGSTGWSNGDWHCTIDNLTLDGRKLYEAMQELYGDKGDVYLMTWLDT